MLKYTLKAYLVDQSIDKCFLSIMLCDYQYHVPPSTVDIIMIGLFSLETFAQFLASVSHYPLDFCYKFYLLYYNSQWNHVSDHHCD